MRKVDFQRRHFEFLAKTIKDYRVEKEAIADITGTNRLVEHFADTLRATNPQFDRQRFIEACGGIH